MGQPHFDVSPFAGAMPVAFGMPRARVHALLGSPQVKSPPTKWRGLTDSWDDGNIQIGYDAGEAVNHIGFGPGNYSLLFDGSPLWTASLHPDPNSFFLQLDPNPLETFRFLVFNKIGVTTTGYHDDDKSQLAITVYPRGAWDESLAEATVPDLSRYKTVR